MEKTVYKKEADAKWQRTKNPFFFRCSRCHAVITGCHHLYCPGCKAQMHKKGDFIYNEETGEAGIVKLGATAL